MKNMIIAHNGSIQNIPGIPADVKAIYKTVWEISQKKVLDLAADRGAFICQSQSLNVHLQSPTLGQLTNMHFYGWKKGFEDRHVLPAYQTNKVRGTSNTIHGGAEFDQGCEEGAKGASC
jgi:hypothetical protein